MYIAQGKLFSTAVNLFFFLEPDPCTLAPERGPCTASITRYHYNVTSQMCQQFSYGGCFPNENNFFTQHGCEDKCSGKGQ